GASATGEGEIIAGVSVAAGPSCAEEDGTEPPVVAPEDPAEAPSTGGEPRSLVESTAGTLGIAGASAVTGGSAVGCAAGSKVGSPVAAIGGPEVAGGSGTV